MLSTIDVHAQVQGWECTSITVNSQFEIGRLVTVAQCLETWLPVYTVEEPQGPYVDSGPAFVYNGHGDLRIYVA